MENTDLKRFCNSDYRLGTLIQVLRGIIRNNPDNNQLVMWCSAALSADEALAAEHQQLVAAEIETIRTGQKI